MRLSSFLLFLATMLLAGVSASAQPAGYVTGVYKIALTIDSVRYWLPAGGYSISSTVIDGDTVATLDVWLGTADAQQGGLPPGPMLKGKQTTDIRFFQETEAGVYQKIAWTEFRIVDGREENGGTTLQFAAEPEFVMLAVPVAGSPMPVLTRVLLFTGPATELTADDWGTEGLMEK